MISIYNLWAKTAPFQSVVTHGTLSGIAAQTIITDYIPEGCREQLQQELQLNSDELYRFIGYFVSLHDIGKINYYFQSKDDTAKEFLQKSGCAQMDLLIQFRHEVETKNALMRIWGNINMRSADKLAAILGAHHQGKHHQLNQPKADATWQILQDMFHEEMRTFFLGDELFIPDIKKETAVSVILLGVTILSDWIVSGEYFRDAESWDSISDTGRQKIKEFLRLSGLSSNQVPFGETFCQVWPQIPTGHERELQKNIEQLFSEHTERFSCILIEAPMGEGKTEAGVYAAIQMCRQWKKNGFYVALPTAATSNQMVGRMRSLMGLHARDEDVKLLHAMAWMVDSFDGSIKSYSTEDEQIALNWLMPLRRGLLSSFAVGTVDQAMMAAMFIKYGVLRLLGLSGKALIIDEIHAYDAYMQNILEGLLAWCHALNIPVVLLSATLPKDKKRSLLQPFLGMQTELPDIYPAITAITEAQEVKVSPIHKVSKTQEYLVDVLPLLHRPDRIAEAAVKTVEGGGCLCILLNTVAQAQDAYLAIRETGFDGWLLLFHSRFTAARREEIEKQCLKLFGKDKQFRPKKAILVATQVVEQSLDVDFDFFMSAIAPIDLMIQRMGRQFRHAETARPVWLQQPVFTAIYPEDGRYGADGFVYPECLLQRTRSLLEGRSCIRVPEDLAALVAAGYDSSGLSASELEKWISRMVDEELRSSAAEKYKLNRPGKKLRYLFDITEYDDLEQQSYLSAQTRLSEPTVRIAIIDLQMMARLQPMIKNGILPINNLTTAREILSHSVSIRKKIFDRLSKEYSLSDITGDKLIFGVKIIPRDNPCFTEDCALGVIWKEDRT